MNPDPVTETELPFCNPVLGVTMIVGVAADAVATPKDVRPPRIKTPIAIFVINRLIVYDLPIAVVTNSLESALKQLLRRATDSVSHAESTSQASIHAHIILGEGSEAKTVVPSSYYEVCDNLDEIFTSNRCPTVFCVPPISSCEISASDKMFIMKLVAR